MSDDFRSDRRRMLGAAAMGLAAAGLSSVGSRAFAHSAGGSIAATRPGTHTTFASLKQVDAGDLSVGYAEDGPADGTPVVLLHGWPYDIHSYVDVAPLLAAAGYRVIVPYLRGYGSTHFLSGETARSGQEIVVACDIIALMDALKIRSAILGGFDWGSRTADIMAALWPDRCKGLVSVSGYLITDLPANRLPLPPQGEYAWWYQYYFATERGRLGYDKYRREFARLIWKNVSPKWHFDDATFDRTAAAFDNPDHVNIVIDNYRWRLGLSASVAKYDALEAKLQQAPAITVPTITVASDFDGAGASGEAYRKHFIGKYSHRILNGIGHNVPQEAPREFAETIVAVDRS